MNKVNPKLVLLLVVVIALVSYIKISNPHGKYSRQQYWETATVEDVKSIPDEAIKPRNKNGPVLMWAATTTKNPAIIKALVERGADINEPDVIFTGTPLSAAAGYNSSPQIIDELVGLGAKVDAVVGIDDKTPLIIAAEINSSPEIIEILVKNGASTSYRDKNGRNALEAARKYGSPDVITILERLTK